MDEVRRLRWLESLVRFRHLRKQQAEATVVDCIHACDVAAREVQARDAEVHALSNWRAQAAAGPLLDLGMLQQSMHMAASADLALMTAQVKLQACAEAHDQAVREQFMATRREDHASERHAAARMAGTVVQERHQAEQSVEAWSRRKPT